MNEILNEKTSDRINNLRVSQAPSVLIVAANANFMQVLARACDDALLSIRTCCKIEAAEEACQHCRFDLIILDWVVGKVFADDLVMLLQSATWPRTLPPVGVLSNLDEKDTRAFLRIKKPIQGILAKPADPREIVRWMSNLLQAPHDGSTGAPPVFADCSSTGAPPMFADYSGTGVPPVSDVSSRASARRPEAQEITASLCE